MKLHALAFSAALVASTAAHAAGNCTLKEYASLDIAYANGRMTVPVKIGGVDRPMSLNLAVPDTGIRQSVADELHLVPLKLPPNIVSVGFAGDTVKNQVAVPEFQIGLIRGKDVKLLLFAGSRLAPDVAGILGTGIFAKLDAELDFKNAKLHLFSPDGCDGPVVVYWADAAASFPFRLGDIRQTYLSTKMDGETLKTSLSTDIDSSMLFLSAAKRIFGLTPESPGMTVTQRNADGTPAAYRYPFKQILFGGVAIANPVIDIYPDSGPRCNGSVSMGSNGNWNTCFGAVDLYLGLNILKQLHLYFASGERTLYITPADAHKEAPVKSDKPQ